MGLPSTPQNYWLQQGNNQVLASWSIVAGATGYTVQRSTDGVNYTTIATPTLNQYVDTAVTLGTQYYYQVASTNGSGSSPYTTPQSIIPTPNGEMSLAQLRQASQQRADRLNSNFVTLPEWNSYINQSLFELYDLLITAFEDYFVAPPVLFFSDGSTYLYNLPDGTTSWLNGITNQPFTAPAFYKLMGVDLGLNNASNAYVTMSKFNFIDRNRFVYPNTASTIYGVFNCQYRLVGKQIEFIPTPSANQPIRIWYVPRMQQLLLDTDITNQGISGWLEYVITDAAIKALQKEESDVSVLMAQKMALLKRIEDASMNRDAGMPDHISDVRQNQYWGDRGFGWNGPVGGW
jgi:hypothetical protein